MKRLLLSMVVVCQAALAQEMHYDHPPEDTYDYEASIDDDRHHPRDRHHHYHPTEDDAPPVARNANSLSLNVARHARRGLLTTMSVRYRKIGGNAIVRMRLSPGLAHEQSNPPAVRGPDGELLWFGLAGPMGSLKIKARIDERIAAGTALLIRVDLFDGYKTEHETETIVAR